MNDLKPQGIDGNLSNPDTSKKTPDSPLESVYVTIDDFNVFEAYHNPAENWNGWICPFFTLREAKKMIGSDGFDGLSYNEEKDVFFDTDSDEEFSPITLTTTDGVKQLYPVGAYYWAWDTYEVEDH